MSCRSLADSQMVKGSVYSYYEFISERLLDDAAWRQMLGKQEHPVLDRAVSFQESVIVSRAQPVLKG